MSQLYFEPTRDQLVELDGACEVLGITRQDALGDVVGDAIAKVTKSAQAAKSKVGKEAGKADKAGK